MPRGVQSRSQPSLLVCACVAGLVALTVAPAAAARPAALEEYVLTLPGVEQSNVEPPSAIEESAERIGDVGVVGEQNDDFTRIGALRAATASPGGALALAFVAGGTVLALRRRRDQS
jgi:hypothetical protein